MRWSLLFVPLAFSALLAACGGSGGDTPAATVNVGGTLAGLGAGKTVVIADASGPAASLSANGAYSLSLASGIAYSLRVQAQPLGQTCSITNGTGTAASDVNNIAVTCTDNPISPDAKTVTGTVSGLSAAQRLVLQLNAQGTTQETIVNADGSFQFAVPVAGEFTITVRSQPTGQACTVATGASITVTCAAASTSFKLAGTVSGNTGVVALRNNANGDTVTTNTNGAFTFAQPVLQGGSFNVVVFDQSASQVCSVANGAGTASADVTNIAISCIAVVAVAPPPPPLPIPGTPTGLTMTYGIKSFNIAWGTVTAPVGGGTLTYRLFEDPDGAGPTASAQIGGSLASATFSQVVTGLLHTRLNAQYAVQACNSGGCSSPTAAITPNLTQAIGYFKASSTSADDYFGYSMALSADGTTLAVSAHYEDSSATGIGGNQADNSAPSSGAVYVFTRTAGVWSQQAYVKASNTGSLDFFGQSVALSGDGDTLAVGASSESSSATGIGGSQADNSAGDSGAVYVFTRTAGTWSQQAYVKASNTDAGDRFGYSVAVSADGAVLAVGATSEDSSAVGIGGNAADNNASASGAVYVFTRAGSTWSQQAYLKASNTGAGDTFGSSVALSGNGDTLAVGAMTESSSATGIDGNAADNSASQAGAVYVFTRAGITWSQQAYVKASNTGTGDRFGSSVALSGDGATLAVGAENEASSATGIGGNQSNNSASSSGAVYVFTRAGITWSQQAYVKASNAKANEGFGYSVALSADGSTLAVSAVLERSVVTGIGGNQADNGPLGAGAVYVFTRGGITWSQQAYVKASNTGLGDQLGRSVALSGDGSTLAVSAIFEDSNATGLGGDQADNSGQNTGAVYLY